MADDRFAWGRVKIVSIPAGLDFLGELARGLGDAAGLANDPGALNDAIIYVPNRRSARALGEKLFAASGARAFLAPDIRALGDLESEEEAPIAEVALNGLPAALTPAERTGALARMVQSYYRAALHREIPPLAALKSARDLARLLDQAAVAGDVDWEKLPDLVERADLALHWQSSVQFLGIIRAEWPEYVVQIKRMDASARRYEAAKLLCEGWRKSPPSAPVIVAGSTGATPAGRLIMRAVLDLPRGLIVLPGFDSGAIAQAASIDAAPSHPQHVMIRTLSALQADPAQVGAFVSEARASQGEARRRMIHAALAPATDTADWRDTLRALSPGNSDAAAFARDAFLGLSICEFAHEAAEAEAAALLMRETLQTPGKTAALVTPDAGLGRRVAALLKQWNINVEPSSGTPLNRAPAGRFALLCARWMLDPSDPLALSSAMKHETAVTTGDVDACERFFLRGPRAWRDFAGLRAHILRQTPRPHRDAYSAPDQVAAVALIDAIEAHFAAAHADLRDIDTLTGADFIDRLSAFMIRVANGMRPFSSEDGRALVKLFEHFVQLTEPLGFLAPRILSELLEAEAARCAVYSDVPSHPRLAIWGPLEARLQTAGRLILAGLNEEVWPARPPANAFLPRRFRKELGLKDSEEPTGLAAHDFAQLACAPEVYLLYARRRDDGPAVPSRWIWRIKTIAQAALKTDAESVLASDLPLGEWLHALDQQGLGTLAKDFTAKPAPKKSRPHWPEALSATRVELLVRDPYALWAEDVLKLSAVSLMNEPVRVTTRGSAIHKAVELFELEKSGHSAERLTALLRQCLIEAGEPEETFAAREAVMRRTSEWYMTWRDGRVREGCASPRLETRGTLALTIAGAPFTLSAVADRIDTLPDGRVRIADFKTGTPPTVKEIKAGFSWQMPLQALIALEGGFGNLPKANVEALEYIAFKAKPEATFVEDKSGTTPDDFARAFEANLMTLITGVRSGETPILSAPRVQFRKYETDFDRLARRAEWGGETDEDADASDG